MLLVPTRWRRDLVTMALAGGTGLAGSYAAVGPTRSFIGAQVESLVVGLVPGVVVATGLRWLGRAGELLVFGTALTVAVGLLGVGTAVVCRYISSPWIAGVGGATWAGAVSLIFTGSVVSSAGVALPVAVVGWMRGDPASSIDTTGTARRRWLRQLGAVLGFGAVTYLVRGRTHDTTVATAGTALDNRMAEVATDVDRALAAASNRAFDVPGMPGLVSRTEDFYEVDIDSIDPDVDLLDWSLSVTGAVERQLTLSIEDFLAPSPEHRFVTLRCVSDPVDGELMDTALWTGVPVSTFLDRAGPNGSWVMLRSIDGYHVGFPLKALRGGFLAYGMNGEPLPRSHGSPLRALVPGHWGEVNGKWIDEIEILEREAEGYWEKRGWHGTGPVNTISKIWGVNERDDGVIELGGHAYAGTRGISRVEVLPGLGTDWRRTELSDPLEGDDVWRQWRYEWRAPDAGTYWIMVRAFDGDGTRQPKREQRPYPSGSTGWMRRPVTVGEQTGPAYR